MAIYRFRISFEDFDDINREIDIKPGQTFEDLHRAIHKSTGYNAEKSSSFYVSTDNWIKGEEIALMPNQRKIDNGVVLMEKAKISSFIEDPHQKFYYIYNFERPYDFHVELIKIILENDPNIEYPYIVKSVGEAPKIMDKSGSVGGASVASSSSSDDFDFLNEMDFVPEDTDELEAMGGRGINAQEENEEEESDEDDVFSNDEDEYGNDDYSEDRDDY
ncbi:plasmid pRiA4b ORF-3 family protein [Pedobacter montanisoli]|uniref:Plasmid pRiA4b ORF-3 family protein n=1 Tax=Pedobacter montanisoli TaxID=2923277 RepID=A0ABS9ZVQ3_9SPHI|nr:plasmid pRiA4b ORF-3 family protein [Pedobacter montanisoli]MCJ0742393.1 plasmid pRiA4b ORF-3 family protein [Pedobacter montanisoli]